MYMYLVPNKSIPLYENEGDDMTLSLGKNDIICVMGGFMSSTCNAVVYKLRYCCYTTNNMIA